MDTKNFLLKRSSLVDRMQNTRSQTPTDWLRFGSTLIGTGVGLVMGIQRAGWVNRLTQKLAVKWLLRPLFGFVSRIGLSKVISTDLVDDFLSS